MLYYIVLTITKDDTLSFITINTIACSDPRKWTKRNLFAEIIIIVHKKKKNAILFYLSFFGSLRLIFKDCLQDTGKDNIISFYNIIEMT